MPSIKVKENEPFDIAIRRFRRACEKAGVLTEIRKREFYEKPQLLKEFIKDQIELLPAEELNFINV